MREYLTRSGIWDVTGMSVCRMPPLWLLCDYLTRIIRCLKRIVKAGRYLKALSDGRFSGLSNTQRVIHIRAYLGWMLQQFLHAAKTREAFRASHDNPTHEDPLSLTPKLRALGLRQVPERRDGATYFVLELEIFEAETGITGKHARKMVCDAGWALPVTRETRQPVLYCRVPSDYPLATCLQGTRRIVGLDLQMPTNMSTLIPVYLQLVTVRNAVLWVDAALYGLRCTLFAWDQSIPTPTLREAAARLARVNRSWCVAGILDWIGLVPSNDGNELAIDTTRIGGYLRWRPDRVYAYESFFEVMLHDEEQYVVRSSELTGPEGRPVKRWYTPGSAGSRK